MVFKRAIARNRVGNIREWVWPRAGWRRTLKYLGYRLVRLDASSHSIAAGVAAGASISFTPFLGLHLFGAFLLAFITRGHLLASVFGTFVGNPWTFPLIFLVTGELGRLILGGDNNQVIPPWSWDAVLYDPFAYFLELMPLLKPYIIGGIPFAFGVWVLVYFTVRRAIDRYRKRKMLRRETARLRRLFGAVSLDKQTAPQVPKSSSTELKNSVDSGYSSPISHPQSPDKVGN